MMKSQSIFGRSSVVSYVVDKPKVTRLVTTTRLRNILEVEGQGMSGHVLISGVSDFINSR